jgi:hypothetical protein
MRAAAPGGQEGNAFARAQRSREKNLTTKARNVEAGHEEHEKDTECDQARDAGAAGISGRLAAPNLCVLSDLCVQPLLRVFVFS